MENGLDIGPYFRRKTFFALHLFLTEKNHQIIGGAQFSLGPHLDYAIEYQISLKLAPLPQGTNIWLRLCPSHIII